MPVQIAEKPPAKKPYVSEKTTSIGMESLKPQKMNTERQVPNVDIVITALTTSLSQRKPIDMAPKTELTLRRAKSRVPVVADKGGESERV